MSAPLKRLLAEARFPAGEPAHSGGVEAACAAGLITDLASLRNFLYGRLWTVGVVAGVTAASVCARAGNPRTTPSLIRTAEAELDARTPSPAARRASRDQGGRLLQEALAVAPCPLLDALVRTTTKEGRRPHHPTVVGIVAAVAKAAPAEAAEVAALATIAGPAFAARSLLGLPAAEVAALGSGLAPEARRLAEEAALVCLRPLSQMPAAGTPLLDLLAEDHASAANRAFAS